MKYIFFVFAFASLFVYHEGIAQQTCLDNCQEECEKDDIKCLDKVWEDYNKCIDDCYEGQVLDGHGYYLDFCLNACEFEFYIKISQCTSESEWCYDLCDLQYPDDPQDCLCDDCPEGFTYIQSLDLCRYTLDDDYSYTEIDNRIYIIKNCDVSSDNDCCPTGYNLALDELCDGVDLVMTEECRDAIRDLEREAALDAAQGDPWPQGELEQEIAQIEDDPDCYISVPQADNCDYCVSAATALSQLSAGAFLEIHEVGGLTYFDFPAGCE